MLNFVVGVITSIVAAPLIWLGAKVVWPHVADRLLYKGIRIEGVWEIHEIRQDSLRHIGELTLRQTGSRVSGSGRRFLTREGRPCDRRFSYMGRIAGEQVTLLFDDKQDRDFDSGTYVFRVSNNCIDMAGMATFHGKPENRIVSEQRFLKKTASSVPS
ncbi:MAG TPA: hypothetical protein VF624_15900 [Tepidisphaeraceae bacterium]|jgi:hypothetical protein